jgi:hypothetical protein
MKSAVGSSRFETGPMVATHWQNASWLGGKQGTNQFRLEFDVPAGSVSFARAYVAAPGCAAVFVNGKLPAVDLRGICPWTVGGQANTRYQTHDITAALASGGKNCIGLVGGNVMSPSSSVLAMVMVQPASAGVKPIFFTSASAGWQERGGSYFPTANAFQTFIDWTAEEQGWSAPGFDSAAWSAAASKPGQFPLRALQMPLSTVVEEVKPVRVEALPGGDFLYTFPKNFVGTIKLNALPSATEGEHSILIIPY